MTVNHFMDGEFPIQCDGRNDVDSRRSLGAGFEGDDESDSDDISVLQGDDANGDESSELSVHGNGAHSDDNSKQTIYVDDSTMVQNSPKMELRNLIESQLTQFHIERVKS